MYKLMFVCHGNICRSPMAEFIFKDIINKRCLERDFVVASSAVSSEEIWNGRGNPIYPPAKVELKRHNVAFTEHYSTLLIPSDYDKYDLFLGMDSSNIRRMAGIFGGKTGKVKKLMDFTSQKGDVSDPWYTGDFERAYCDIEKGCMGLLDYLLKEGQKFKNQ